MNNKHLLFLLLSFIEGACVMAAELLGAKMMAPFYGTSLYVWSAVMAITLGGLATGYFFGGIIAGKKNNEKNLYTILIFAAVFTMFMPITAQLAFVLFGKIQLLVSVSMSAVILLFPPVFLMGMVSPLITSLLSTCFNNSGRAAGTVYAVSTVGGILSTFLFGFYVIPEFGLKSPALFCGLFLSLIPIYMLAKQKNILPFFIIALFAWQYNQNKSTINTNNPVKLLYYSEGLLGQIIVLDMPVDIYLADSTRKNQYSRWMYVNRISQTMYDANADTAKGQEQYFTYVHKISQYLTPIKHKGKKVLLLGLGGGVVAKHLYECGFEVDACELDYRIYHVARSYFGLNEKVSVITDDARHYINTCEKKYDVVIFDTFKGEETPSYLITKESLTAIKNLLNDNGLLFLNSFGYIEDNYGLGNKSIFKTLNHVGFQVEVLPTEENEDQRNLLFIASCSKIQYSDNYLSNIDTAKAVLLNDDIPVFEKINSAASMRWRNLAIKNYYRDYLLRNFPLFY